MLLRNPTLGEMGATFLPVVASGAMLQVADSSNPAPLNTAPAVVSANIPASSKSNIQPVSSGSVDSASSTTYVTQYRPQAEVYSSSYEDTTGTTSSDTSQNSTDTTSAATAAPATNDTGSLASKIPWGLLATIGVAFIK